MAAKGGFSRYQSYTTQKKRRERLVLILVILVSIFVGYNVLTSSFLRSIRYDSRAMEPTLHPGTVVMATPLPYGQSPLPFVPFGLPGWATPQRGELVLMVPPYHKAPATWGRMVDAMTRFFTFQMISPDSQANGQWDSPLTLRRVIGLPGDTVRIEKSIATVKPKGEAYFLSEYELSKTPYSLTEVALPDGWRSTFPGGESVREIVLGPDDYFVLADNRGAGQDSRTWGPVKRQSIQAKALFKYWPPQEVGGL